MLLPSGQRHLPRSRPGTGPTSTADTAMRAELAHLHTEVTQLVKEQQVQLRRIAEIQQQLNEIQLVLKKLLLERP
jgi:hypothetical protein